MNIGTIAPYQRDEFGRKFSERHSLLIRAVQAADLQHPLRPSLVSAWADQINLPLPTELREAIAAIELKRGSQLRNERPLAPDNSYANPAAIDPREHRTLQIMIAAMATYAYGYKQGALRQTSTAKIVAAVQHIGLTIDEGTVLKHIRESIEIAHEEADPKPNSD
ncbi:MAG: hypothetical protein ACKVP7_25765 [Hyphomicrobiaceae bacterium]